MKTPLALLARLSSAFAKRVADGEDVAQMALAAAELILPRDKGVADRPMVAAGAGPPDEMRPGDYYLDTASGTLYAHAPSTPGLIVSGPDA